MREIWKNKKIIIKRLEFTTNDQLNVVFSDTLGYTMANNA